MMVIVHLRFIMFNALFNALLDMFFHFSFSFSSCMIDMLPYWHNHCCAMIRFSVWRFSLGAERQPPFSLIWRRATTRFLLQGLNAFRGLSFSEGLIHGLARLLTQRLQIRALRAGHRFIARSPVLRVFDRIPGGVGTIWGCITVFHCAVLLSLRVLGLS